MKFTKQGIAELALPDGKSDLIVFADDLPGFGIRLRPGGRKTFVVQYRAGHKQHRETLGDVRRVDLAQARDAAKRKLGAVSLGHDPAEERQRKAALTMGSFVPRFLERKRASVRASSFLPIKLHLGRAAALHEMPVHKIARRDVAAHLAAIGEKHGPNSAKTARVVLGEFFAWCMGEGLAESNPVIGTNEPASKPREHRVLTDSELAQIWAACGDDDHGRIVKLCILTGCRKAEISELRWTEIGDDMIRLPPERVKSNRAISIPLLGLAAEIITGIPACKLYHGYRVFGARTGGGGFSGWSDAKERLDARIAAAGKSVAPWVLHDTRRTFATRLNELGVLPHIVDSAIGHAWGDRIARTYNKAQYTREIRAAFGIWDDHIRSIIEDAERKVVAFERRV
jgi:integrase